MMAELKMWMETIMFKGGQLNLRRKHRDATVELARLNREMALKMIVLAHETGDIEPLIEAVKALRSADEIYSQGNTPIENAEIQKKLGDVLLGVGKTEQNQRAIEYAIIAYRGAITIASLLGAENLRASARKNYALALNYSGRSNVKQSISLMGAA